MSIAVIPASAQTSGTNQWAWMGGSITGDSVGVYGTLGTAASENAPGGRYQPVTWTDNKGNLWLFGGQGVDSAGDIGDLNDFWKFDPLTNEWTWMGGTNNLGSGVEEGVGVYGTLGTPAAGNIPPGRAGAVGWTDAKGNLWLFGGGTFSASGGSVFDDLWEFNPSTNEWAWMGGCSLSSCTGYMGQAGVYGTLGKAAPGNMPGSRESAMTWTDSTGNLWLFGGNGFDSAGMQGDLNDLWMFNPTSTEWTWVSGANLNGQAGVYGTLHTPAAGNVPGARSNSANWIDKNNNLWLFGGSGAYNDLWEYNPTTNEWVWMGGFSGAPTFLSPGIPGTYGLLQVADTPNEPGSRTGPVSWTDNQGNFWLFGGLGDDYVGHEGMLNDLWEFNPTTNKWTWMAGSESVPIAPACSALDNWCGDYGVYGTLQTPSLQSTPGGRDSAVSWTDSKGNFWLFGGAGFDGQGNMGSLGDLWEFQPNTNGQPVVATPEFTPYSKTITTSQPVTITDTTPGATIYYTINGNAPTLEYTAPITVTSSETIEAIASASGYANSNILTATYFANLFQAATPTFSVVPGTYATAQTVSISDTTPGATIYYAIGSTPTTSSTPYSGQITVSSTETIEAIAVADNYRDSVVAMGAYNIQPSSTAEWTWMGGISTVPASCLTPNECGQPGWYGTQREPSSASIPGARFATGSWTGNDGKLWLFGGVGFDSTDFLQALNDLWEFDPSTGEWAWMSGSNKVVCDSLGNCYPQDGVYGTLGTPSASNTPGGRQFPATWTDKSGHLWLFGGQGPDENGNSSYLNDLWKFDPSTNEWTWMGGDSTLSCVAAGECSADSGIYGALGKPAATNRPGGRSQPVTWTDSNGNFWLYGGFGADFRGYGCQLDDLWEFNPSTTEWTWVNGSPFCAAAALPAVYGTAQVPAVGNTPGGVQAPVGWADANNNLWLFGGITNIAGTGWWENDMWEFSPSQSEWDWVSPNSFGGTGSDLGTYTAIGAWNSQSIPGGRADAAAWTDSEGNFWFFGGSGVTNSVSLGALNDLWEFKPSINQWAWMGGSTSDTPPGSYGTLGTPAQANAPGGRVAATTWTDNKGNLWLFGGGGYDASGTNGLLNDLWQYGLKSSPSVQPPTQTATPTLSLAVGAYTGAQTLKIADATPNAAIYYTTDGTAPGSGSSVYSSQITVSSSESVQAIAVASGSSASGLATAAYTITAPLVPTFAISALPVTVIAGDTTGNTSMVTVTPGGGFAGNVVLTAAITATPNGTVQYPPTLSFGTTSPVSITGANTGTATLTISTTAASGETIVKLQRKGIPWYAAGSATLACILLFAFPTRLRRCRSMLAMVVLLAAFAGGVLACGGGGGGGIAGTTQGVYTITVTGTSGATTATSTVMLDVE